MNTVLSLLVSSTKPMKLGAIACSVSTLFMFSINAIAKDEQSLEELEIAGLYVALMKDMPETAQLSNSPYTQAFTSYGTKTRIDDKSVIKGGKALRVKVSKGSKKPYSKGSSTITIADISAGDTLCLTFWARSINAPEKNLVAEFASVGIQESSGAYANLMSFPPVRLSYDWQQYAFKGVANQSKKASEAQVFFHYGHLKQRLEIGPTFLFNLGQDVETNFKSNACGK